MRTTRWLAATAVSALVLAAACNNPHLSGGKLHYDQKRYDRAEENFQLAVQEAPESAEAWMFLAMAQAEQGKTEVAAGNFVKAKELALADSPLAEQIEQNRDYYFGNRFNSAIAFNEKAEEAKNAGDQAAATENYQKALAELELALVYKPESARARSNIGITYLKLGEIDKALATFDDLAAHSGDATDVADLNSTLLLVYAGQGNESLQKAIELRESDSAGAQRYLEAAMNLYDKALAIAPDDIEARQNQATVAWELADHLGEGDAARKAELLGIARSGYEAVLAKEPDNLGVMKNLMLLCGLTNDSEAALGYARTLVDRDPKDPTNWVSTGRILGQMEKKTEMFGAFLVGQALTSGRPLEVTEARSHAEKHGPRSEQLDRYRESGDPDEIREYTDTGGGVYEIWFYWARGNVYAFQSGKALYTGEFQKVAPAAGEGEGE